MKKESFIKILINGARLLLGVIFLIFGLDGFFHFVPVGPSTPEAAIFYGAIIGTGYLFQVVKVVEIICGLLFLFNRFVPLALAMIAPIIVNIAGYLIILNQSGQWMAILLLVLEISLFFNYKKSFQGLFQAQVNMEGH